MKPIDWNEIVKVIADLFLVVDTACDGAGFYGDISSILERLEPLIDPACQSIDELALPVSEKLALRRLRQLYMIIQHLIDSKIKPTSEWSPLPAQMHELRSRVESLLGTVRGLATGEGGIGRGNRAVSPAVTDLMDALDILKGGYLNQTGVTVQQVEYDAIVRWLEADPQPGCDAWLITLFGDNREERRFLKYVRNVISSVKPVAIDASGNRHDDKAMPADNGHAGNPTTTKPKPLDPNELYTPATLIAHYGITGEQNVNNFRKALLRQREKWINGDPINESDWERIKKRGKHTDHYKFRLSAIKTLVDEYSARSDG